MLNNFCGVYNMNVVYLIFLIASNIFAQDNKAIEKKWGIEEKNSVFKDKEYYKIPQNFKTTFPIHLEPHKAEVQSFAINPSMENVIKGKWGTEITIPPNSISLPNFFRKGDIITIELREIVNDLDFLTMGVDTLYYDSKGKPNLLESDGMFEIKAIYFNRELNLKRGSRLIAKFPSSNTNNQMKVYFLSSNGNWIEKGNAELFNLEEPNKRYFNFFSKIDSFGIWNLAFSNPEITCIQGEIQIFQDNPPYFISVLGINYMGAYTKNFNESNFKINVLQSRNIKVIAFDSKGNFGFLEIKTPNKQAFLDFTNYNTMQCHEISKIEIKQINSQIRSNRESLLKHLGIEDKYK